MTQALHLVERAKTLLADDAKRQSVTTRLAAWHARAALEEALGELVERKGVNRPEATAHALICLVALYEDDPLPAEAAAAWWGLSRACHYPAYELAPTAAEVRHLVELTATVVARAERPHVNTQEA